MIDLCKLFGVEEREEFKIRTNVTLYRIYNNSLQSFDTDLEEWRKSSIMFNYIISSDIIKLPKKKEFTVDELFILKKLNKAYKWIARDSDGDLYTYINRPSKDTAMWRTSRCKSLSAFNDLFQSIQWEDEEPVFIDDYVERGGE